jgi:glycine/D-amino acid oxidase-like deaminating enzyme
MTSSPDILIVGQGLGGTILGLTAERLGMRPTVVDRGRLHSSSMVAAGMVNPFILKRRKLVWRAGEFIPDSKEFYAWCEGHIGVEAYHETPIYRIIHDEAEWNDWDTKSANAAMASFHGGMHSHVPSSAKINASMGYFKAIGSSWMDIPRILKGAKDYWSADDRFFEAEVQAHELDPQRGAWTFAGRRFDHVCLAGGLGDPLLASFFPDLPFTPAKGHVLDLEVPGWGLKEVLHGAVFVIPLGKDRYRVGSTYSWHLLDESIEEKELAKLKEGFERICPLAYSVHDSRAGVRPSTKDRRPFIGRNPAYPGLYLFNGLGSRAVMNGPTLAKELLEHIIFDKSLDPETDLGRFT